MARNSEFYKGRRKRRNRVLVPAAIALAIISLAVVLFYGIQKYAVITKERVSVRLPFLTGEESLLAARDDETALELETTNVSIIFQEPDYSSVQQQVDGDVPPVRAIFLASNEITRDKLVESAGRLIKGNALVLEMKPASGALIWDSKTSVAASYGLAGNPLSDDVKAALTAIKEQGVYLVAQISVCRDDLFASRSTIVTLRNKDTGGNYIDDGGAWLDAYSMELRRYTVELVRELYSMGFDEVVLANVMHPTLPEGVSLLYTRDMSTSPGPVNAVCGFALAVAQELSDRDGYLSIYLNSAPALVRADANTGQDGRLFMKLFDRVYYNTDRYAYTYNLNDIAPYVTVGKATNRFVPVVINYLPDNSETVSWVLIDRE
ncbi:MAG: hypothetical protein IJJ43_04910 [Oscillospiraceae bacterium]|nr:hypothetical protein [Oscillospiraceae bacterium]